MAARSVDEALVDEALRGRMTAAALADRDELRARGERQNFARHERIVKDDFRGFEQFERANRQKIDRPGTCAHEIDGAANRFVSIDHRTIPAATVSFVASSIRTKLPVA